MCCLVTWLNDGSDGTWPDGRLQGRMPLVGLETISDRSGMVLAETGQHVQLIRQPRTEKLQWAAALVPDDAEAQVLFAKAWNSRPRTGPASGCGPSEQRTRSGRSFRSACTTSYGIWSGTAASAGRAGTGPGLFRRSASVCRWAGVSGGAASATSGSRHPGRCRGAARGPRWGRDARRARSGRGCPAGLWSRFRFRAAALVPWSA